MPIRTAVVLLLACAFVSDTASMPLRIEAAGPFIPAQPSFWMPSQRVLINDDGIQIEYVVENYTHSDDILEVSYAVPLMGGLGTETRFDGERVSPSHTVSVQQTERMDVSETLIWQIPLAAGEQVAISHRVRAAAGAVDPGSENVKRPLPLAGYLQERFCADPATLEGLSPNFGDRHVEVGFLAPPEEMLVPARFELVVESVNGLLLSCWKTPLERLSPSSLRFRADSFRPMEDLWVAFLLPPKP